MSNTLGLLCIDAGNTLVKWCVHSSSGEPFVTPVDLFSHPTAEFKPFSNSLRKLQEQLAPVFCNTDQPLGVVLLSNVLGPDFEQLVRTVCESHGVALHVLSVNKHPKVQSAYQTPALLGKDRWADCMALTQVSESKVNLLVSFGTATTLDVIVKADTWTHQGGYIVPGIETMFASLHSNTAELPHVELGRDVLPGNWPLNTQSAIGQGVGRMQTALVQSVVADLQALHGELPALWLTGGFALTMQNYLPDAKRIDYAVFKGLVVDYQLAYQGES